MMDETNSEQGEGQSASSENFDETDPSYVDGQKKPNAGAIGLVGLLVLGGAAFYFFYLKGGPSSASAAQDETSSAIINDFLHGSTGSSKLMEQTLHDTEKVVKEFQAHAHKNQIPVEDLQTNPFRLKVAKPQEDVAVAVPTQLREEEERKRITTEANGLELGSIVRGGRSACLVNNTLYHQGEQIGNFTVVEIRPKSVVVRQGKYSFELTMKK